MKCVARRKTTKHKSYNRGLLAMACLGVTPAAWVSAQDWNGSTQSVGSWNTPTNWNPTSVPTAAEDPDFAYYSGNQPSFSVNYDYPDPAVTLYGLSLSADSDTNLNSNATLLISANTLSAGTENIGGYAIPLVDDQGNQTSGPYYGAGTILQSGRGE